MGSLRGRRILVTRSSGQAAALSSLLTAAGAEPVEIPAIELAPPASFCALDAALASLRAYDWLLFTSANAVTAFMARARRLALSPNPQRIAVIGPATARAVLETGLAAQIDLLPQAYVAESLAEALAPHAPGASFLLVRAAVARDVLPETLTGAGGQVTIAEVYRTVVPQTSVAALRNLMAVSPPDAATFTSASTARNLAELLQTAECTLPGSVLLASIGPVTSQAMRELGLAPAAEAFEATLPALVACLEDAMRRSPGTP